MTKLGFVVQDTNRGQRQVVTAQVDNEPFLTHTFELADSQQREDFSSRLNSKLKEHGYNDVFQPELLQRELEQVTSDHSKKRETRKSPADRLVEFMLEIGTFHHDTEGNAFASIKNKGHEETYPVESKAFQRLLSGTYFSRTKKAVSGEAKRSASAVLEQIAAAGLEIPTNVRLARHENAIWLDLGRQDWQLVQITSRGWKLVPATRQNPVRFWRPKGIEELPKPVQNGDVSELRRLLNLDEESWTLIISWLVAALRPGRPFPVLVVNGEHGSGKSTVCRMLRQLIDPNVADLRSMPRDDRDLVIQARNGWIVGLDNISSISPDRSDALARLSTGSGFGTRSLYTNSEEALFSAMRPILVNGIGDVVHRPDLLDRSLLVHLRPIPEGSRLEEAILWKRFHEAQPRVLGALLDAVVVALRRLPEVQLDSQPRMADFTRWAVAAEPALGLASGSFLETYQRNRSQAYETVIQDSPIAQAILALLDQNHDSWKRGSMQDLLDDLEAEASEKTTKTKGWPKSPRGLRAQIDRLAPVLRTVGVSVETGKGRERWVRITRGCKQPSQPSNGRISHNSDGQRRSRHDGSSQETGEDRLDHADGDGRDGRDGRLHWPKANEADESCAQTKGNLLSPTPAAAPSRIPDRSKTPAGALWRRPEDEKQNQLDEDVAAGR